MCIKFILLNCAAFFIDVKDLGLEFMEGSFDGIASVKLAIPCSRTVPSTAQGRSNQHGICMISTWTKLPFFDGE
jgi:hypothetical protein